MATNLRLKLVGDRGYKEYYKKELKKCGPPEKLKIFSKSQDHLQF